MPLKIAKSPETLLGRDLCWPLPAQWWRTRVHRDGIQPSAKWIFMWHKGDARLDIAKYMPLLLRMSKVLWPRLADCIRIEYRAISFSVCYTGVRPRNLSIASTASLHNRAKYYLHHLPYKQNNTKGIKIVCSVDGISYISCWTNMGTHSHFVDKANVSEFNYSDVFHDVLC